jgi:trans-aconitate 2-methyltransferase
MAAQCGGAGNTARFRAKADAVARREPYAVHLCDMGAPWNFAAPAETEARLAVAGFAEAHCWLADRPVVIADGPGFLRTVLLNYHVQRLPDELADRFVQDVASEAGEPLHVDYVRLNIDALAA